MIAAPQLFAMAVCSTLFAAPPPQQGIALGLFSSDGDQRYAGYLDEIVAQGASHVSLVTVWYQKDIHAEELRARKGYTVSDAALKRTIGEAHARGLKVMLFPIVGIDVRGPKEWRGRIKPDDWGAWFASYRAYIVAMARIAASEKVEIFSVGSELLSTERMRERWAGLLREVRGIYRGQVIYSANWDHFEPVSYWDLVDAIGVTAYYELSKEHEPSRAELVKSWRKWKEPLVAFARKQSKPLIFTEIGYPALDGANTYPWDETRKAPVDLDEQKLCYEAFVEAWDGEARLEGVYFWNWFGKGGRLDGDYTPRGKPAARVIQGWYREEKR